MTRSLSLFRGVSFSAAEFVLRLVTGQLQRLWILSVSGSSSVACQVSPRYVAVTLGRRSCVRLLTPMGYPPRGRSHEVAYFALGRSILVISRKTRVPIARPCRLSPQSRTLLLTFGVEVTNVWAFGGLNAEHFGFGAHLQDARGQRVPMGLKSIILLSELMLIEGTTQTFFYTCTARNYCTDRKLPGRGNRKLCDGLRQGLRNVDIDVTTCTMSSHMFLLIGARFVPA